MEFEEKLIEEMKKHPMIYNLSCKDYKNVIKKNASWKSISEALGIEEDACRKRWKSLRDTYRKSKQRTELRSGSAAPDEINSWKYANLMAFFDDVPSKRDTVGNLDALFDDKTHEALLPELEPRASSHGQPEKRGSTSLSRESPQRKMHKVDENIKEKFSQLVNKFSGQLDKEAEPKSSIRVLFDLLSTRIEKANLTEFQKDQIQDIVYVSVTSKLNEFLNENN